MADEYIERHCSNIQITDPLNGDNIELGERAETALDVSDADYPSVFKTANDAKIKDYESFLLNAEGDYNEEEAESVKQYYEEN